MEMYAHGQFAIDRHLTLHLGVERPFFERGDSGGGQLSTAARLEDYDRHSSLLRDQHGVSITDACLGWKDTAALLNELAESIVTRPA